MKYRGLKVFSLILAIMLVFASASFAFGAQSLGSRTLKQGMSGDDVAALQTFLMGRSYAIGSATGYFGPKTLAAVKQFQQDQGLTVDGIVGPKTFAAISSLTGSGGTNPSGSYTVRSGDTLYNIARQAGVTVAALKAANHLTSDMIYPGQVLTLPGESQPPTDQNPPDGSYVTYPVVSGDSLYLIAQKFGSTVQAIKTANNLTGDIIFPGQVLRIPQAGQPPAPPPPAPSYPEVVTAKDDVNIRVGADPGQTIMMNMAKGARLPVESVSGDWYQVRLYNNTKGWVNRDDVTGRQPENLPARNVIGFYTDAEESLDSSFQTMTTQADKLSSVAPFWFQINGHDAASLVPFGNFTEANARQVIIEAHRRNTKVLALVHNLLYKDGSDSKEVMETLLSTPESRKRFIDNVVQLIDSYGFNGVNLDTEYIKTADRDKLSLLLQEMKEALTPKGYVLTISIPGKTSDDPNNSWSGPFNYAAIGQYADEVVVMLYLEHGYPGSPPGPIASAGFVDQILQFSVSQIPPGKIIAALPVFGADFYLDGQDDKSLYLSYAQVMSRANANNAEVVFDKASKSPMFDYTNAQGQRREVWFEDADSISAKIDQVNHFNLKGLALWRLGMEDPAFWSMMQTKINVEK